MTKQQLTDLQTWKQDQNQPLPDSLKNVLIERCLEELKKEEVRNIFNEIALQYRFGCTIIEEFNFNPRFGCGINFFINNPMEFDICTPDLQLLVLLTLLSHTPDGQAAMPFLNVETKEYKNLQDGFYTDYWFYNDLTLAWKDDVKDGEVILIYKTLKQKLKDKFLNAITENGKRFDQALEIINLIYLQNV